MVVISSAETNVSDISDRFMSTNLSEKETNKYQEIIKNHKLTDIYKDEKYMIGGVNVLDYIAANEKSQKAINDFIQAAEKEKVGKMNDAVAFYRSAMRICEDIEKIYRTKIKYEYELELLAKNDDKETKKESNTADKLSDENEVLPKEPCLLLDLLPKTILSQISLEVFNLSPESFVRFASTCSSLQSLCFKNNASFYRNFAERVYKYQVYDMGLSLRISPEEKRVIDEWNIVDYYNNDYEKMLKMRPYIKFQGVYISVNNYIRQGGYVEGSSSLFNPIHMVTYYRYFRFMPNGDVIRLLTTDEPSVVVKNLYYGYKDSVIGRWSINTTNSNLLTIERLNKTGDKCYEQLNIENHRKVLPHNKLTWIESFFYDEFGEKFNFNLKKEKNFYFSRVRSYDVEIGALV
jgi:F-box protein 9